MPGCIGYCAMIRLAYEGQILVRVRWNILNAGCA
jgi:hypothetical protein